MSNYVLQCAGTKLYAEFTAKSIEWDDIEGELFVKWNITTVDTIEEATKFHYKSDAEYLGGFGWKVIEL